MVRGEVVACPRNNMRLLSISPGAEGEVLLLSMAGVAAMAQEGAWSADAKCSRGPRPELFLICTKPFQLGCLFSPCLRKLVHHHQGQLNPPRPGKGSAGIRCIVKANHFFAELPDRDLHQYDVSITPEVSSRLVSRQVMKKLVDTYRESHLGKRLPAYDGRKSLYTAGPLPFLSSDFRITLIDEDEGGNQRREREFKVVIKLAARADLHHLDMSSTAFFEPLPVIEFVAQLLNRDATGRPLFDSDRVKVGHC
ncbi:hypothetical protein CRG98_007875 [Punica granatum]|uniref:Protein argonaute N-terminal domain-containing protein n=1 Tax=Punica granatum TaxID=22663 RepID=A0A2I0KTE6_PUNGR|nr:hypothetical protein CRG98_007875 [Punica granatum]